MKAGIRFEDVSFAYKAGGVPVLDHIDLQVNPGEFVAVLGANGSGKSTLAKHMNALLLPTSGHVFVGEIDTKNTNLTFDVRSKVGMLFQNPDNQAVAMIVEDDIAFGPENLELEPDEVRERVEEALAAVAMQDHAKTEIATLSGGQKQRVAIAGVLAMRPQVLVLDEPGAMLDMRGRRGIRRVAHELNDQGMSIVLITHFMEDALGADRVIVLDRGRIALQGTPEEVLTNADELHRLRLEMPFSVRVADDLRKRGIQVGLGLSEEKLEEELCLLLSNR